MDLTANPPKVSVCVVTYNQEKYIRQCLQSIVDQVTNFTFEIIVGDDCSSDGTREIVEEFASHYPDLIRLVVHEKNTGPTQNYLSVHKMALGEFVAHIDGDDYMLPGKLQIQADCLASNLNVSFAVHAVKIDGSEKIIGDSDKYPVNGSIYDLLKLGTYFVHSSVMYRRCNNLPNFSGEEIVDYYFHIERAANGSIYLDREPLGCYRVHDQGITKNPKHKIWIEQAYERAFDYALNLGIPRVAVESARLHKRMSFAIADYLSGDIAGYKKKIYLDPSDFSMATFKHKLLHRTVNFPTLLGIYMAIRLMVDKNS